jgi:putative ABC transport system permease protein
VARGVGLGVLVAVLFSVPALLPVLRVPPARVLRRDAEPLPAPLPLRMGAVLAVLGGAWLAATVQSRSVVAGSLFSAGMVVVVAAAAAASLLLARAAGRVPEGVRRYWLRHGLAALARPGADTLGAMVALALGTAAVLGLHTVESHLSRELEATLPATSPSTFFVDVQPHQWGDLEALLEAEGAVGVESQPMVMGRLLAVDGVGVGELARGGEDEGGRRWALTREQRLTYGPELPRGNRVVAGRLWSFPGEAELSVEEEYARDLGLGVGSRVTFDIQGVPVGFRVGSLRQVEWRTFGINFFLHAAPGTLEAAPQQRLAVARLPQAREHAVQDRVVEAFPNVTVIQIREVLEKVGAVLGQAATGVRLLGWFTVVAGLAILGGAVSAGEARRGREVAVLKTVGVTRAGVVAVFAVEYLLVGGAAGLIGVLGGLAVGWGVTVHLLELPWRWPLVATAATVVAVGLLAVVAGVVASARALGRPPVTVLRSR